MQDNPILKIDNVTKSYGAMTALHGISVDVVPGEFIALVGPSGSGKSTLLKCIAGFEEISGGAILMEGSDMEGVSPSKRPTSMVFQKLALFPHKTVAENIGFPLKLQRIPASSIAARVDDMLQLMALKPEYLSRYPHQLSGGEQQRVALARSMISSPKLLLLDEPLSALDVKLRKVLQAEIKRLHRELGVTFVHVTHDLEEAMMLADRICVLNHGRLEQVGSPQDIYYRPATSFVAGFISETNIFDASVAMSDDASTTILSAHFGDHRLTIPSAYVSDALEGGEAKLMVRPERMTPLLNGKTSDFTLEAVVDEFFVRGSTLQYICSTRGADRPTHRVIVEMRGENKLPFEVGAEINLGFDQQDCFLFSEPRQAGNSL
jgi:ABC-type Fe3+/spermidine/putrescine transport system ATPase subunit